MMRVAKGGYREASQLESPLWGWLPPTGEGLAALMQARLQAQGVGAGPAWAAADLKSSGGAGGVLVGSPTCTCRVLSGVCKGSG
jgi:hypothetical protein